MSDRRTWLLYGGVVALVQLFLVAGVWVKAPHNGGDNAGYVALAHSLLEGTGYVETWDPARPLHTKYPPLFPAMLAVAVALGARTWTALKLVPAAFSAAAVLLAFVWAGRRRTPFFGAVVALLLAAAPGVLWYSHWVLSDVPFLALTLLALVALERASPPEAPAWPEGGAAPGRTARATAGAASRTWLAVGFVAAVLAYFTRSAGLPLLVAVAGWLALRMRWKALGAFAALAGVPAALWWLRGRGGGVDYVGELWMVDPYDPSRGTVGVAGLVGRALDNLVLYTTRHVPEGLVGSFGGVTLFVGLALLALALLGWGMRLVPAGRERSALARVHVAELFFPLYAGLILLWPQVWSGDRFALPLFPLILFYGGDALLRGASAAAGALGQGGPAAAGEASGSRSRRGRGGHEEGRRPAPRSVVAGAAVLGALAVGVPAVVAWSEAREGARACAALMRTVRAGPYDCHGPPWGDFAEAARWSGANLPGDAAVLTRKPRIFYVMGGTPSRTYPFTTDPEAFFAVAADAGARWVLFDALDRQAITYLGGVVGTRPEAFCSVASFGEAAGAAQLLGILPPGREREPPEREGGRVRIPACEPPLRPVEETEPPPVTGLEIPLLTARAPR